MGPIRLKKLALALSISLSISCDRPISQGLSNASVISQSAIIEGEKCSQTQSESAVEIIVEAEVDFSVMGKGYDTSYSCSGTLIAPDVVITAAHCLEVANLTAGVGTLIRSAYYVTTERDLRFLDETTAPMLPKKSVRALAQLQNEQYDNDHDNPPGLGNDHDVGLLFLERPLHIKPAVVITKEEAQQISVGKTVSIAGWGRTSQKIFNFLDPSSERNSGVKYCALSMVNEVGDYEMQIGSDAQSARKCFGDSGGPTYMDVLTKYGVEERLIGITSRAYDDGNCDKGGVDTRVDAWLDWIDAKMQAGCKSGVRVWCEVPGLIKPDSFEPSPPIAELDHISFFVSYFISRL